MAVYIVNCIVGGVCFIIIIEEDLHLYTNQRLKKRDDKKMNKYGVTLKCVISAACYAK